MGNSLSSGSFLTQEAGNGDDGFSGSQSSVSLGTCISIPLLPFDRQVVTKAVTIFDSWAPNFSKFTDRENCRCSENKDFRLGRLWVKWTLEIQLRHLLKIIELRNETSGGGGINPITKGFFTFNKDQRLHPIGTSWNIFKTAFYSQMPRPHHRDRFPVPEGPRTSSLPTKSWVTLFPSQGSLFPILWF